MSAVEWDQVLDALIASVPELDELASRLALATYQALVGGEPVDDATVAARSGLPTHVVRERLAKWPDVTRDENGWIRAFWGLDIAPTRHSFLTGGVNLYTWCAWDALFLPSILRTDAEVRSRDPQSDELIVLTVTPAGIAERSHPAPVLSFLDPSGRPDGGIRTGFCKFVNFFTTHDNAAAWTADHDGSFVVSVERAYELGARRNQILGLV